MEIIERDEQSLDDKLAKPTYWGKVAGLTVQELKPALFDECLRLMERHLVPEEAMCVGLGVAADAGSTAALLAAARECMRDGTSVVVLKGEDYVDEEQDGGGQGLVGDLESADVAPHGSHDGAVDRDTAARAPASDTQAEQRDRGGRRQHDDGQGVAEAADGDATGESQDKEEETEKQPGGEEQADEDSDESHEDDEVTRRRERKRRRHKRKWAGRKREDPQAGGGAVEPGQGDDGDGDERDDGVPGAEVEVAAEQRVVAVLVARVVQRLEHMRSFSRVKVVQGDAYQKWLALRCHLQRTVDLFEEFAVDAYYRLYHIVVHPDYRRRGVGSFLVQLAVRRLAELFARPDRHGPGALCTAVAPSRASQRLLARQGFRPQAILNYHEWKDEQGQPIVSGAGVGNYNVALVAHQAPATEPGEPADVSPLEPEERVEEVAVATGTPPTFDGLGWPRPPSPRCPPAHEEPPFGVAVAASTSRPPTAPTPPLASSGTSGTSGRGSGRSSGGSSGRSGGGE